MSNQTPGEPVKDLVKRRREYLGVQAGLGTQGCAGLIICVGFGLLAFAGIPLSLTVILSSQSDGTSLEVFTIFLTAIAGFISVIGYRTVKSAGDKSRKIPYVPPVRAQIAALPAEEVLIRASDKPPATPEELLRAAQAGREQRAEELLRPGSETT